MKNLVQSVSGNGYNVIAVDWSRGADTWQYWNAAASTKVIGAITAHLIMRFQRLKKAKPEQFHVIGHSLGAQVAGAVGYYFHGSRELGRVTGKMSFLL